MGVCWRNQLRLEEEEPGQQLGGGAEEGLEQAQDQEQELSLAGWGRCRRC